MLKIIRNCHKQTLPSYGVTSDSFETLFELSESMYATRPGKVLLIVGSTERIYKKSTLSVQLWIYIAKTPLV